MFRRNAPSLVCLLLLPLLVVGCDGLTDITEMNSDPTSATSMNPELQFVEFPLDITDGRFEGWRANLIHAECISQHLASPFLAWSGCRYTRTVSYNTAYWNRKWGKLKNFEDVLQKTTPEENPELTNVHAMTRILRVFLMHRMTDLYGNIPYEQGGKGLSEGVQKPEYDSQEEIYPAMITDLQEARGQLDPSVSTLDPSRDPLFGDKSNRIEKWRRFANSLLLRLGMRMSEVAPDQAQSAVQDALNSGVMQSNDDIVYTMLVESNGVSNGIGNVFNDFGKGGHGFRISKTFMDILKGNAGPSSMVDPRTSIFAAEYLESGDLASNDPAELEGMPNGLTTEQIPDSTVQFAMPNYDFMVREDSPDLWMSYAEVKFLEAEAALRGWHPNSSDVQAHYEEGIRAAMKHLTIYGAPEISDSAIQSYVDSLDPLPADPNATLERIIEQKWVALFLNGYESWAELRRTGYPDDITPVDFPGNVTGGEIPSRLIYPSGEATVNGENFEAGSTQPNEMKTSLWWDTDGPATIQ